MRSVRVLSKCAQGCGEPALGQGWPLNHCSVCFYLVEVLEGEGCSTVSELSARRDGARAHREAILGRLADVLTRCGVEDGAYLVAEVERLTHIG